jgi:secondary thiamine-phosphate synthase enzyme
MTHGDPPRRADVLQQTVFVADDRLKTKSSPLAWLFVETVVIDITNADRHFTDLTNQIAQFCRGRGDGLCSVFVPHATAGVAIFETGAGSESDLDEVLARVFPRDDRWTHRHGSAGHGADHVLPAFVAPSITVPVMDGSPTLGTWQSVVLVDLNRDNPQRSVRLSFIS